MNKMKNTLPNRFTPALAAVTLSLLALSTSAHAATLVYSTTAPSVDGDDIYNFTGTTGSDVGNVSGGDDNATYLAGDRGPIGQTFTTGSNVGGYTLSSISLQHATYSQYEDTSGTPTLTVRVGTFSGAALTPIFSDTITLTGTEPNHPPAGYPDVGTGNFLTVTFAPVTLAANTSYFFDLGVTTAAGNFFIDTNGTSISGTYTGGEAYHTTANGLTMTADTGDHVFVASMTAIPEPSTYAAIVGALALGAVAARRRRRA